MQGLGCTGLEFASLESHRSAKSDNYCKHLGGVRLSLVEIIESTSKAGAKKICVFEDCVFEESASNIDRLPAFWRFGAQEIMCF